MTKTEKPGKSSKKDGKKIDPKKAKELSSKGKTSGNPEVKASPSLLIQTISNASWIILNYDENNQSDSRPTHENFVQAKETLTRLPKEVQKGIFGAQDINKMTQAEVTIALETYLLKNLIKLWADSIKISRGEGKGMEKYIPHHFFDKLNSKILPEITTNPKASKEEKQFVKKLLALETKKLAGELPEEEIDAFDFSPLSKIIKNHFAERFDKDVKKALEKIDAFAKEWANAYQPQSQNDQALVAIANEHLTKLVSIFSGQKFIPTPPIEADLVVDSFFTLHQQITRQPILSGLGLSSLIQAKISAELASKPAAQSESESGSESDKASSKKGSASESESDSKSDKASSKKGSTSGSESGSESDKASSKKGSASGSESASAEAESDVASSDDEGDSA